MSYKVPLSSRVRAEQADQIEHIVKNTEYSKSEAVRKVLDAGLEAIDADGEVEIPDYLQTLNERQDIIKKNKVQNLKGGFRNRVFNQFKSRFRQNWSPEEIEMLVEGYRDEIDVLFSDEDKIEAQNEFIDNLLEQYHQAYATSDYDPFDGAFEDFTGVQNGTGGIAEQIKADADDIQDRVITSTDTQKDVVQDLTESYDISVKRATDIVEDILGVED